LILIVVVSDTSPIRALDHLRLLPVLKPLFNTVLITPGVERELMLPRNAMKSVDIAAYEFIEVREPQDRAVVQSLRTELQEGESEAIALAMEVGAPIVLMDEMAGRTFVARHGMIALGTLGILLRAKKRGLVEAISPLVVSLSTELNFFMSDDLKRQVLRMAGEDSKH
jgi:hypothetical protein